MSEETFAVKRILPRFPFIAEVEVIDPADGVRLSARISDISVRGCYVDTLNPIANGREIRMRITHGGATCELPGKVIYVHAGYGMGILFGDGAPGQHAVLAGWLSRLTGRQN